ncbi:MAG: NAD(P)-dependent oxidoreductase [Bryobacteraceae bacterium]
MRSDGKPVILITGSEGLIGDALVRSLSHTYHEVGFDIERRHKDPEELDFINCDLTKDASVNAALEELERHAGRHIVSVIHLAAYYDFSGDPSPLYRELTIEGTRRLLRGLQRFDVEQFVFSSTHILMKPSEEGESITEQSPLEPAWAYPKSKLETERLIQQEHGKIPAVILRIAGVYNEDGHTVPIAQQIDRIARKDLESYFFPGDPDSGQAYIHLQDLVDLIRRVIERRKELGQYEVFLAAEPEKLEYDELQDIIGELVHGRDWPTIRIPKAMAKAGAWIKSKLDEDSFIRPWMIDRADDDYPVSIEYAREKLDWNPSHRLRDTLPAIVEAMKRDPVAWRKLNGLVNEESKGRDSETSKT